MANEQINGSHWESQLRAMMDAGRASQSSALRESLALLGILHLGRQLSPPEKTIDPLQFVHWLAMEIERRNHLRGRPLSQIIFSRFQGIAIDVLATWLHIGSEPSPLAGFSQWFSSRLDTLGFEYPYDTPSSLSRLVSSIFANRSPRSVFDPACGTGGFLAALTKGLSSATVLGEEISAEAHAWAQLRFLVLDLPNVTLLEGNALSDPTLDRYMPSGGFDMILTNPPFGQPVEVHRTPHSRGIGVELVGRVVSETAYVNRIAGLLSTSGIAAVVVPNGFLSRAGTDQKLRETLVSTDILQAIIGLPERLFAPATAIGTAILILNREKSDDQKGRALFVEARGQGNRDGNRVTLADATIERIRSRYCDWRNEDGFSQVVSFEQLDPRITSFSPSAHVRPSQATAKVGPNVRRARILELDKRHAILCEQYEALRSSLAIVR
ncbi:N-6 DNA methylase [Bradyrhizobium sp. 138]|uniref:N-6 DNA methylase n=1 Tax=Bradyrhizobium sp. 138 TaxID=2782615 RepID=UPI001FF740B5|nr:N-6 DNA methylase [Bradyrhizobium sp. 138]MCK1733967.1 N-6 DNA methylase [Bradyrhizobium sp. 138]